MKEMKVLLLDRLPEAAERALETSFSFIDRCYDPLSEVCCFMILSFIMQPELLAKIANYHIVCVGKVALSVYLLFQVVAEPAQYTSPMR